MKWLTNLSWSLRGGAKTMTPQPRRNKVHQSAHIISTSKQATPTTPAAPTATTMALVTSTSAASEHKRKTIFPKFRKHFTDQIAALQRGTREHFMYDGTFYQAIGPVLAMAQFFGVMPVCGVQNAAGASALQYRWLTVRTVYAIVLFVLTAVFTVMTILQKFEQTLSFDNIVPIIFYVSVLYIRLCFGLLARRWPSLMRQWARVERQMPPLTALADQQRLAYRIKMLAITVLTMSLAEHILNIISIVSFSNRCNPNQEEPIRNFFLAEQSQFFRYVDYRPELAVLGKIINGSATFLWSYMDLFVMMVSVGLATRFRQINESLRRYKGAVMSEQFWREHRLYYRSMCDLVRRMDDSVAHITMVSFANNLYFVCMQLLRSLNPMASFAHAVYFWYSLIFLIMRTLAVSLYAANINDEAKKPARVFRAVPRESWCLEVKRFSDEVTYDIVALSGMKFFHITRKLVLSVAGTIVTYELVLIQFNDRSKNATKPTCE